MSQGTRIISEQRIAQATENVNKTQLAVDALEKIVLCAKSPELLYLQEALRDAKLDLAYWQRCLAIAVQK